MDKAESTDGAAMTRTQYVALQVTLTLADVARMEDALPASAVAGTRYDEHQMREERRVPFHHPPATDHWVTERRGTVLRGRCFVETERMISFPRPATGSGARA
jgi:hypothetical protein